MNTAFVARDRNSLFGHVVEGVFAAQNPAAIPQARPLLPNAPNLAGGPIVFAATYVSRPQVPAGQISTIEPINPSSIRPTRSVTKPTQATFRPKQAPIRPSTPASISYPAATQLVSRVTEETMQGASMATAQRFMQFMPSPGFKRPHDLS